MKQKPVLLGLLLLALLAPLASPLRAEEEKSASLLKAESIRIETINFKDTPLSDSLSQITAMAKEADPEKKGISIVLDPKLDLSKQKLINLNLKDVSVFDYLRVLGALNDLKIDYGQDSVTVAHPDY